MNLLPAKSRETLAYRPFALLFAGQTVSKLGNGVTLVALGWTVLAVTHSAADVGLTLTFNTVPQLAFVLLGGAIADRLSRRILVLVADGVAGIATGLISIAAVLHYLRYGEIAGAASVLGIAAAIRGPAYQALVSETVPSELFGSANGLMQAGANIAQVVGPAVAGVIYSFGHASATFAFDSGTYVVAVVAMVFTRLVRDPSSDKHRNNSNIFSEIREGIAYSMRMRWLRTILAMSAAANVFCMAPYLVLLPVSVRHSNEGVRALGFAYAVGILATAVSSLSLSNANFKQPVRLLAPVAACLGLGTLVLSFQHSPPLLLIGAALIGFGCGFEVIEVTMIQSMVPANLMSRVFSVDMLFSFALLPIAYLMVGKVVTVVAVSTIFEVGGITFLALVFVLSSLTSRTLRTRDPALDSMDPQS